MLSGIRALDLQAYRRLVLSMIFPERPLDPSGKLRRYASLLHPKCFLDHCQNLVLRYPRTCRDFQAVQQQGQHSSYVSLPALLIRFNHYGLAFTDEKQAQTRWALHAGVREQMVEREATLFIDQRT